ncbi:UNVERIFIED_CONTAM: putative Flp pilus-assembly TadE/G-like protein [Acetivibrio alkalicellulosi]
MYKTLHILKSKKGSTIVVFAFAMTFLLGICALVVDLGMVVYQKNIIRNAVDAAVLAGAQELVYNNSNAKNIANEYLEKNGIDSNDAEIILSDSNTKIRITVNKEVKYYFAKILGFDQENLVVSGSAICAPVSGVYKGIRPFAIAHQTLYFGETYILKEGAGGDINGNFAALALGGTGASNYRGNIIEGYNAHLKVGDYISTETGNMSGPTFQGVNTLLNQCDNFPPCTFDNYDTKCPRVITVIIVETLDVNGRQPVKITGFAKFFLEGVQGHGNESIVTGKFIQTIMEGDISYTQTDYGIKGIKLIE